MHNKESNMNALNTVDFTEETVYHKLCKLRADKSPGVDGIYPVELRNLASVIFKPLSHVFSQSLLCNIVPHDWKLANATPLLKKGPKNKASSYRPVSLASQVCKIMESILKDNIINHLEQNGLIRDSQHGFRAGRSCLTNLLHFMDKRLPVVYLDFSKSFDKVTHNRLINKIKTHGIEEEERKLYFNNLLHIHQHAFFKYMIQSVIGGENQKINMSVCDIPL